MVKGKKTARTKSLRRPVTLVWGEVYHIRDTKLVLDVALRVDTSNIFKAKWVWEAMPEDYWCEIPM